MLIFHKVKDLKNYLALRKNEGASIGFVPTMGALHKGHLSLIESSKKRTSITVCSIFVNPAQFNNRSDFEHYPVTISSDLSLLAEADCDVLFLPDADEIYPGGTPANANYELGFLETVLEGVYRPGHFQGVCLVMDRLLSIIEPHHLFMGSKDYQQCMVVKRLIELKAWASTIQFHTCPTLREADGLAMSSRNLRLNAEQRKQASNIYETLIKCKQQLQPGDLSPLKEKALVHLQQQGFQVDYVEFADASSLQLLNDWNGAQPVVLLIAAFLGQVRLIDNLRLSDHKTHLQECA